MSARPDHPRGAYPLVIFSRDSALVYTRSILCRLQFEPRGILIPKYFYRFTLPIRAIFRVITGVESRKRRQ